MDTDDRTRYLSPNMAQSHHTRTRSFKSRPRPKETEEEGMRPRRNSMPSQPRNNRLSSSFNDLLKEKDNSQEDSSLRRVRSFKTTSKGGVVNRGDSYKRKSYKEIIGPGGTYKDENTDPQSNQHHDRLPSQTSDTSQGSGTGDSSGSSSEQTGFTVVVLGPPGVGKTSLISQFMTSEYVAYEAGSSK